MSEWKLSPIPAMQLLHLKKRSKLLSIFDILQIRTFILKLKYMRTDLPESFKTFFICNFQVHQYSTRQSNNVYLPMYNTSQGQYSIPWSPTMKKKCACVNKTQKCFDD